MMSETVGGCQCEHLVVGIVILYLMCIVVAIASDLN